MSYTFNIPIALIEHDVKNDLDTVKKKSFEESKRICLLIKNSPNIKEKKKEISKTLNKCIYKKIFN